MYKTTQIQDCMTICKKFERGAIFTPTEQAGLAMLGPVLDGMRIHSKNYVNQAEALEQIANPLSAQEQANAPQAPSGIALAVPVTGAQITSNTTRNLDKSDENDENLGERIAGQFGLLNTQGNFDMSGSFDSKCIPCNLRVDDAGLGAFFTKLGTGFVGGLSEYINFWEKLFARQLQQLQQMLNLFDNPDPYMDLCAFIKFFTDFVCIPDLARIISTLMALMQKVSFEFSGIFDIILQLIGPLFGVFLGNLVGLVEQFIMMVVRPIECIIDSIQAMIAKLDYNVLFQNIASLDKHIDLGGPKKGALLPGNEENEAKYRKPDPRGDYVFRLDKPRVSEDEPKLPWIDGHIARRDIVEGERFAEYDFNMAGPVSTWIKAENARDQAAIEQAAAELAAIRRSGRGIDGADPQAIAQQRARERAAMNNYRAAVEKRNTTYVGRANRRIDEAQESVKSSLILIIGYMREAAQAIQGFFDFIFDEFKKLMGEYVGGSGGLVGDIIKKNALSRIINLLVSIFKALQKGAICEDDPADIKIESWLPEQQGLKVWTDDEGQIHIEGDETEIDAAIDAVVEAVGVDRDGVDVQAKDKGGQPDTASQRLKSLIEFTGDPVLDTEIARITEQLTTPMNAIFKCPLNTTVAQTEQINQWIKEVNS